MRLASLLLAATLAAFRGLASSLWWWLAWVVPMGLYLLSSTWNLKVVYSSDSGYLEYLWPSLSMTTALAAGAAVAWLQAQRTLLALASRPRRLTYEWGVIATFTGSALLLAGTLWIAFSSEREAAARLGLELGWLVLQASFAGLLALRLTLAPAPTAWIAIAALWLRWSLPGAGPRFLLAASVPTLGGVMAPETRAILGLVVDMAFCVGALWCAWLLLRTAAPRA